jgi:hypothetical protein
VLAYIIIGIVVLIGIISIIFIDDITAQNVIKIGLFSLATLSMLILFLVKMARNKQIDWYLIGLLVVLCLLLYSSYQRL